MEIDAKRGINGIAKGTTRYTMIVHTTMLDYIKKLCSTAHICGATLIYSMWKGYKETELMHEFLTEIQSLGITVIDLHTSGHAKESDIELLKSTVNAKRTVLVHTEYHG